MQVNRESNEINTLTDILNWASENQKMWYRLFRPDYNDNLSYGDLIETIMELTEKKYYVLLFVLVTLNRFNCHLDEILEQAIYRFCAKKLQEDDIQEFSQFVIENLNTYAAKKENEKEQR